MKSKESVQSGKFGTYTIAAILLIITILTKFYKELFVNPSGNIEIFGNLGFLLAIGLIWRWKYIRQTVSVLTLLALLAMTMALVMAQSLSMPFLMLMLGMGIAFYLATYSSTVRLFLNEKL